MLAILHPSKPRTLTHLNQPFVPTNLPSPAYDAAVHNFFNNITYSTLTPSPIEASQKLNNYFDLSFDPSIPDPRIDQFMTTTYPPNPTVRIQSSTPTPQLPTSVAQSRMMMEGTASPQWHQQFEDKKPQLPAYRRDLFRGQQQARRPTSSSSTGQLSPYPQSNGYPYIAQSDYSPASPHGRNDSLSIDDGSGIFQKHLPTPTHTPTTDSFNINNFNKDTLQSHYMMQQALLDQQSNHDEVDSPGYSHSAKHSVSSFGGNSPATPRTIPGDEYEDRFKVPTNDMRPNHPHLDRTMSDIYQDTGYNVYGAPVSAPQPKPQLRVQNPNLLSPHRNVVSERLQAANNARSQSPASVASRDLSLSPFRQGSPLAPPPNSFNSPRGIGTAAGVREQQQRAQEALAENALAYRQHLPPPDAPEPKTISPKDAVLDYNPDDEDNAMPLFPDAQQTNFQFHAGQQYNNIYPKSESGYGSMTNSRAPSNAGFPSSSQAHQRSDSGFTFMAPPVSSQIHALPFSSSGYRPINVSSQPEPTPEFPAHLTSMESSVGSDNGNTDSAPSSQGREPVQKPHGTTADSGTYTCTYHGCSLRFETPAKLQKHKREGHRQPAAAAAAAAAATSGSGMTSAALLAARNSQAGPHRCDRINPSTGKPCNTVFSRPYDLTRHEDTIHNAKKQKVKCFLCTEEKTFSRNDALTRHMRVVHPDVDFPGKHSRRRHS